MGAKSPGINCIDLSWSFGRDGRYERARNEMACNCDKPTCLLVGPHKLSSRAYVRIVHAIAVFAVVACRSCSIACCRYARAFICYVSPLPFAVLACSGLWVATCGLAARHMKSHTLALFALLFGCFSAIALSQPAPATRCSLANSV